MHLRNIAKAVSLMLSACIVLGTFGVSGNVAAAGITLSGSSYAQKYGDISGSWDASSATLTLTGRPSSDESYRQIEAVTVGLNNSTGIDGSLRYSVYVQQQGWQEYKSSGAEAGTKYKGLKIEGLKMELTGDLAEQYTVEYSVKMQKLGNTQGYVSDGTIAGIPGETKIIEEIKIRIVPARQGKSTSVSYRVHRESHGWDSKWAKDGAQAGTPGQSGKIDGIEMHLSGNQYKGGITYRSNIQKTGWEKKWMTDGSVSGTIGSRLESVAIKLTGEVADHYDVYYRVYTQSYGWIGWAKNGETNGTVDLANRLEAIQIILVAKGSGAPGDVGGIKSVVDLPVINPGTPILPGAGLFKIPSGAKVAYAVRSSEGWSAIKADGQVLEVSGPITGLAVAADLPGYGLNTFVDMPDFGELLSDEKEAYDAPYPIRIIDAGKRIESLGMNVYILNGSDSKYVLYYRVKTSKLGWMAWNCYSDSEDEEDDDVTGGRCGTDEVGNTISAIQIVLLPRGQKPAADLNGITSDKEKPYYTIYDFPAPYLVTSGNKFASWCLKTFPLNKKNTAAAKDGWGGDTCFRVSNTWKYRYGGASKKGCDCSGFIVYVMKKFHKKKVYHGMYKLSHKTGKNVSYSNMKPGDMLCDWSYHHGWVHFYVGKDNYGHEVVLSGYTDGTKTLTPTFEYWDIKEWLSHPKHSLRRR